MPNNSIAIQSLRILFYKEKYTIVEITFSLGIVSFGAIVRQKYYGLIQILIRSYNLY